MRAGMGDGGAFLWLGEPTDGHPWALGIEIEGKGGFSGAFSAEVSLFSSVTDAKES
jgi:hypothetical protein